MIEFLSSIPRIPLWMTLAALMPTDWSSVRIYFVIITILAFLGWTGMAREVRGKALILRSMDCVMAAPVMIIVETSLSFLGFCIQPPMTSLGALLREAQNVQSVVNFPWLFSPAIVIIVTTLAFNFLGDGLRDAADPYSQRRRDCRADQRDTLLRARDLKTRFRTEQGIVRAALSAGDADLRDRSTDVYPTDSQRAKCWLYSDEAMSQHVQ